MSFTDTDIFLDTNFLAYLFDSREENKKEKARKIFHDLVMQKRCKISTQVLQELFNVCTKKLKYTKEEAKSIIEKLSTLSVHEIKLNDIKNAMEISIKTQFTIYDSLIIAAASAENCSAVYSEDLNDGQIVEGVKIVNPFCRTYETQNQ